MSSTTQGGFASIRRFLAIFLIVWALVFAFLAFTNGGTSMIVFLVAAVVCLLAGVYFARSFAFLQKKEF